MNDRVGILLKDTQKLYFFCAFCATGYENLKRRYGSNWDIWDVFEDQIPENWGQPCQSGGCTRTLREGIPLFASELQIQEFYEMVQLV